jgi:hypothetical protein
MSSRSLLATAVVSATGTAALAVALASPDALAAGAAESQVPERCSPSATYMRAEVVDSAAVPLGAYMDSRCPGRLLVVGVGPAYHYVRHSGVETPDATVTVTYLRSATLQVAYREATKTDSAGAFATRVTDVASFTRPGEILLVQMRLVGAGPSPRQDLIEYALMAGFVA